MKNSHLICGALLMFATPALSAGFINMMWNDCPLAPGVVNVNNACTSNNGSYTLITSFGPPADMPQFMGCAGVIDLQTNVAVLSQWWHMETGGCRDGKMTWDANFSLGPYFCIDFWQNLASGGIEYAVPSPGLGGTNTARIRTLQTVATPGPITVLDANLDQNEYYAFKIKILKALSTGTGACAGCLDKACLVFNSLSLSQPALTPDVEITCGPQIVVTYNNGTGVLNCLWHCQTVPTHKNTWGSIKAIYR
ncbi:MAG: hypothetical protein HYR73_02355 [Candidatus Eisenbacteria bacterium]|nr:hypothetical protein [Candidatus Eisenbacteria bacterium]